MRVRSVLLLLFTQILLSETEEILRMWRHNLKNTWLKTSFGFKILGNFTSYSINIVPPIVVCVVPGMSTMFILWLCIPLLQDQVPQLEKQRIRIFSLFYSCRKHPVNTHFMPDTVLMMQTSQAPICNEV